MTDQTAPPFDFDDWAGLYLENPEEFEARRKAVLMLAMTKGTSEQCAAGRVLLERYEKQVEGQDAQKRMQVSAAMLLDSVQQLQTELMLLKQSVEKQSIRE
jgi:hypothetical protein